MSYHISLLPQYQRFCPNLTLCLQNWTIQITSKSSFLFFFFFFFKLKLNKHPFFYVKITIHTPGVFSPNESRLLKTKIQYKLKKKKKKKNDPRINSLFETIFKETEVCGCFLWCLGYRFLGSVRIWLSQHLENRNKNQARTTRTQFLLGSWSKWSLRPRHGCSP